MVVNKMDLDCNKVMIKMEQNNKTAYRRDIAIQTQNFTLNLSQVQSPQKQGKVKESSESPSKQKPNGKSQAQIIKEYEKKISSMSHTIFKLTKKNEEHNEQFRVLNQKLNKAFSKLTPGKLKSSPQKSSQTIALTQEFQRLKKDLQNEIKRTKQLKNNIQILKETSNLLNNQDKLTQLKNQLVEKHKQIKQLKQTIKVYERAEQNEKKMTHFKKQQELNKKLHQLNQQNIFSKKKMSELKTKLQEQQKQKALEKAQQAIERNLKPKKATDTQQWIKKQIHDQQIHKLQEQVKIYESAKLTLEKTHKHQIDSLRKQNQILNEEVEQLKFEIRKKNKEKFILQHRTQQLSEMKKSILQQDRNSLTIDTDDKNQRYKTFSLNLKSQTDASTNGLRKQFLGLSYGNFGNDYKKFDDSTRLDDSKAFTISSLQFKYFQEHILSLKVKYKYNSGEQIQLQTFDVDHYYTNVKTAEIIFQEHQYIKDLDIYCGKMVEFIQIKTSRNQLLQVGNEKNQVKCKKYSFDIKNHQKPVAFGSITQVKKTGDTKKQCLVVLGLIIKRKDVSINPKKRVLLNSKNQTIHQRGSLTERSQNVKQIKSFYQNQDHKMEIILQKPLEGQKDAVKDKEKEKDQQKGENKLKLKDKQQKKEQKLENQQKQKQGKQNIKKTQKYKDLSKSRQKLQKLQKPKVSDSQKSKSNVKR